MPNDPDVLISGTAKFLLQYLLNPILVSFLMMRDILDLTMLALQNQEFNLPQTAQRAGHRWS